MSALRAMLAVLYGAGVRLRNLLYDAGLLRGRRLAVPVISVGSLEAGGAGKTPLVALVCDLLCALGRKPAVLTRGYRGALEKHGGEVHARDDAAHAGDEPLWLARRAGGVRVYAGRDRLRMGALAIESGAEVLVLDDGFQHRRLARDLDLVLVDGGREPASLRLLPAGPLREPAARGLRRAGLLVLRGARGEPPREFLRENGFVRVVDEAVGLVRSGSGESLPLDALRGRNMTLVAGIARPERFLAMARSLGVAVVETRFFDDHHPFTRGELESPRGELLTTEKDAMRLPPGTEALVLAHRLRVVEGEELLLTRIAALWSA